MNESNLLVFVLTIVSIFIYIFAANYTSRKSGAKFTRFSFNQDFTFYFIYFTYLFAVANTLISVINIQINLLHLILGFILIVFSIYINILARTALAENWTPFMFSNKSQTLVETGIYSKIRHPIYLSLLLLILGCTLISFNFSGIVAFILFCISIAFRINYEELYLIKNFNKSYIEYSKRVSRLIPHLF